VLWVFTLFSVCAQIGLDYDLFLLPIGFSLSQRFDFFLSLCLPVRSLLSHPSLFPPPMLWTVLGVLRFGIFSERAVTFQFQPMELCPPRTFFLFAPINMMALELLSSFTTHPKERFRFIEFFFFYVAVELLAVLVASLVFPPFLVKFPTTRGVFLAGAPSL